MPHLQANELNHGGNNGSPQTPNLSHFYRGTFFGWGIITLTKQTQETVWGGQADAWENFAPGKTFVIETARGPEKWVVTDQVILGLDRPPQIRSHPVYPQVRYSSSR